MQKPQIPENESARLRALRQLEVLDTGPEERFDRITRLARRSFDVPIALVSLVDADRQWFKSAQGLEATETPREVSFCGHAIHGDHVMVVSDALGDERFADNPLVSGQPRIRFYAGCPLEAPDGSKVGTLCLIDREPRELDDEDLDLLRDLAAMVEDDLAARALAMTDELTGLTNRRGFLALGDKVLKLCARVGRPASLLFIDLDGFKSINDRFGHDEGDRALRQMAALLLAAFRETDVIARMGGDEFCVLLAGAEGEGIAYASRRLEECLAERNAAPGAAYALECSVGVQPFDRQRHTCIEDMMRDADERMYAAKRARSAAR